MPITPETGSLFHADSHIIATSRLLRVLKNDKRAIFTAAAHAERAAAFLHGLQPQAKAQADPEREVA